MPTTPLVSVIIPTFNRADLLSKTIRSVLDQTWERLEIIVVDDGSTDNTAEIVNGMNDCRIRYLQNSWSGLPAIGRNTGIHNANGDFLCFLDSDDLWTADKVNRQVEILQNNPETMWCFTHCSHLNHKTGEVTALPIPAPLAKGTYTPADLLCTNFILSPTVMVRAAFLKQTGVFNESRQLRFVEDWEMWLRLTAFQMGQFVSAPLALYRLHPGASTHAPDILAATDRCLACINTAIESHPAIYAAHYDQAIAKVLPGMMRHLLVNGEGEKVRAILKKAIRHPGKTPYLFLLRILSSLPSPLLTALLSARRTLGKTIGKR